MSTLRERGYCVYGHNDCSTSWRDGGPCLNEYHVAGRSLAARKGWARRRARAAKKAEANGPAQAPVDGIVGQSGGR